MGNQSADNNPRVSLTQIYTNLFATRRSKALLFIGTLVIALVISASFDGMGISDLFDGYAIESLFLFPAASVMLIIAWLSGQSSFDDSAAFFFIFSAIILWVVYLGIMINGVQRENIRTSKVLFVVFAFLLLLNVSGCYIDTH